MSEGLNITLKHEIDGLYSLGAPAGDAVVDTLDVDAMVNFVTGSGASQADGLYREATNIAASGSETLNLNSLTDPVGQALDFVRIKAVIFYAAAANTNDVIVGAAASTPFVGPLGGTTPTVNVRPGGYLCLVDPGGTGWLTSGANNLKLANSGSGSAVNGSLIIIGAKE